MKKISLKDYYIEHETFPVSKEYYETADFIYDEPSDTSCFCNRIVVNKAAENKKILIYDDYYNEKETRIIFEDKFIYYLCGLGKIIKLNLETLKIEQEIELEQFGTYFDLYLKYNRLVISGELNVYVLDLDFNIIDHLSAPDVLLEFEINDKIITVKDFNGEYYNLMIK